MHLGIPVLWADEMAQPVEGLSRKPGDVSLFPGTHVKEEGEKRPYRAGLGIQHTCCGTRFPLSQARVQTHGDQNKNSFLSASSSPVPFQSKRGEKVTGDPKHPPWARQPSAPHAVAETLGDCCCRRLWFALAGRWPSSEQDSAPDPGG